MRMRLTGLACLIVLLAVGCMKAGPPGGVPTVVVPVTAVSGSAISLMATADAPHTGRDPDGRATGERVEVEWQGSWLPATLLERRGDRWLVHYENRGAEWDEAVERERIRALHAPIDVLVPEDENDP